VLKAGTPVVIKAPAGDYDLSIVPAGEDAKSGVPNSMLHGTYVSTLISDVGKIPFTLDKPSGSEAGFYKVADSGTAISANQAWVELASYTDIVSLSFKVDDPTGVDNIGTTPSEAVGFQPMYDLSGRRLTTASDGRITIQGGKKTFVK
jgi:hypothetical protein